MNFDKHGNITTIGSGDSAFVPALPYTYFEIDGTMAQVGSANESEVLLLKDDHAATLNWLESGTPRLHVTGVARRLSTGADRSPDKRTPTGASGTTSAPGAPVHGAGEEALEAANGAASTDSAPDDASPETIGVVVPIALDTQIHIPEYRSTGRLIDSDMPLGESYEGRSNYNFVLLFTGTTWLRLMIDVEQLGRLQFGITRHPSAFMLTVTWPIELDLAVEFFDSMNEAISRFRRYMKERFGVLPLSERRSLPAWPRNVPLVFTLDLLRSNGEITNGFADIAGLARDLKDMECPPNTLFYLAGWNGDYDAGYPFYEPHPDLGGETAFREMVSAIHVGGYRVMIHTNPQGIDPYHKRFPEVASMVRLTDEGKPSGWQIAAGKMPPSAPLKFRTDVVETNLAREDGSYWFETVEVLDHCEAVIELGRCPIGSGGARVTVGRRSQVIPAATAGSDELGAGGYRFPYAFALAPGSNRIHVQPIDGTGKPTDAVGGTDGPILGDKLQSWYRIVECYRYPDPYAPWTFPIQNGHTEDPAWIDYFVAQVKKAVVTYDIDAVHLDAATHTIPHDNSHLFTTLAKRMPGVPIGGEWTSTFRDVGYWAICQGCTKSLVANTENVARARDCNSTPVRMGIEELFSWLDKPSPVCSFARDYIPAYLHLCAVDSFVPVGKVCNILPPRKMPPVSAELTRTVSSTRRYGTIPNLRVNYRDYGLDVETREAIERYVIQPTED